MDYVAFALACAAVAAVIIIVLRSKGGDQGLSLLQQEINSLREQMRGSIDESSRATRESLQGTQKLMQEQLESIRTQMQNSLETSRKALSDGFSSTSRVVTEVTAKLSRIEESNKRIFELGKSISELQDILRAPKLRGGLGELFLEDLLRQILPPEHFKTQYRFRTGEIVDAVIMLGKENMVPVDAKFPLESFRRLLGAPDEEEQKRHRKQLASDIRKHIDSISERYIRPEEGTFDFAMMYIPAENIYYETIISEESMGGEKSLLAYSLSRKIIPVSPNTFYAYLKAILLGLRGLRIEKNAQEVIAMLGALREDLNRFQTDFDRTGVHISHAEKSYSAARRRLEKLSNRIEAAESFTGLPTSGDKAVPTVPPEESSDR